jgi:hypothetical protein
VAYSDDFSERCREFIVVSCLFRPPRSPFPTDNKVVNLMLQSGSAIEDTRKTVYVIERGVKSYG